MNNKGGATTLVLGILLIIAILGWAYTSLNGECRSDSQCQEGFYCGVDRECHAIPVIEKEVTKNSLLLPSIILAAALIISAVLLRLERKREQQELQEHYNNYYRQWYESQVAQVPEHTKESEETHKDQHDDQQ